MWAALAGVPFIVAAALFVCLAPPRSRTATEPRASKQAAVKPLTATVQPPSAEVSAPGAHDLAKRPVPPAAAPNEGKLYLMTREQDLTVSYQGRELRLPAMLQLPVGRHVLELRRPGQGVTPLDINIKAGAVGLLSVDDR